MNALSLLFSRSGRLAAKPFAIAIALVYVTNFFSQILVSAPVTGQVGLWPFVLVQIVLVWSWIVLHLKRMQDAGKSGGVAIGIACLYVLTLVLVMLVLVMITGTETSAEFVKSGQGLIRIFLVVYLFAMLVGSADFGVMTLWLIGFVVLLLLPVLIAFGYSIWAATRPSVPAAP